MRYIYLIVLTIATFSCAKQEKKQESENANNEIEDSVETAIKPLYISEKVENDSDDPAIWINKSDKSKSLIVGTDKGDDSGMGALYVFDLKGKKIDSVMGIHRPNNVDVAYGLDLRGESVDIAVCTERHKSGIRVFKLPEMTPIDGGGIEVYKGDSLRETMGVALYTHSESGNIYAIVGRKEGPKEKYLRQYLLKDNGEGKVVAELVRRFGNFSGKKEIEAIAVDDRLGYIYYSDENVGVRKYYAHPDSSDVELALFGTEGFTDDHEGISIYNQTDSTGFILVSDQQANKFQIFRREGEANNPHEHNLVKTVLVSTVESDGNEVTSENLGSDFPNGLFVAMSDDGTFQLYSWEDIATELF